MEKIPIVVIGGATASGKTALSIALAKRYGGRIISADSMQIYRRMDIGSAKPTMEERAGIRHELMDIAEPTENYSVADYVQAAHLAIADAHANNELPIVVGGTGLYINSLVDDIEFQEVAADPALRAALTKSAEQDGGAALYEELKRIDPEAAEKIQPQNLRRVIRAVEVFRLTGKTISQQQRESRKKTSRYLPLMMAISWNREILYDRINQRVDQMVLDGLFLEAERLIREGCNRSMTSMQGIGYKQFLDYWHGLSTKEEMIRLVKRDSRRYAKRQITWFRRDPRIHWLDAENDPVLHAERLCDEFLETN